MKTEPKNTYPLGYVELPDGAKPIYPMNDIFLSYTFQIDKYWETLRLLINIVIEAYTQHKPDTRLKPIKSIKEVKTQFKHLLNTENVTRDQDIKLIQDNSDSTYIEFQNRGKPSVPIELRSVQYFGLGIGHGGGKLANQIWLLAENVKPLLHGKVFARYILKDEITGVEHPASSGILYVSLPKLADEDSSAGELARFLLGKIADAKSDTVQQIANSFNASFGAFKSEKEVVNVMSARERGWEDGWLDGREEGREEGVVLGAAKILELIKKGLTPEDAFRIINEGQQEMVEAN